MVRDEGRDIFATENRVEAFGFLPGEYGTGWGLYDHSVINYPWGRGMALRREDIAKKASISYAGSKLMLYEVVVRFFLHF